MVNSDDRGLAGERLLPAGGVNPDEARFRAVIDGFSDPILNIDERAVIRYVNDEFLASFGYQAADVIGRPLDDLLPPEGAADLADRLTDPLRRVRPKARIEHPLRRSDGAWETVETSVNPLRDPAGSFTIFLHVHVITERKRTELALRESEARYKNLFENNPSPMWIYDEETLRFVAVNDMAVQHYGYSEREFLSMTIADIRPLEDVPRLLKNISEVHDVIQASAGWRHRLKGGGLIDVEIISHRLPSHGGERHRLVIATDVTERVRAAEAVVESNTRFAQMANTIQEVFWMYDNRQQRIIYISPAYQTIWGRSVESIYTDNRQYIEAIYPEDRGIMFAALERQARGERTEFEYRVMHPDGSLRWIYDRSFPLLDEHQQVVRTVGIAADITRRKQAEDGLRASEDRYRRLVENSHDMIQSIGPDSRFLFVNRVWLETLGYREDEVPGMTLWDIIHPSSLEACEREFATLMQGQDTGTLSATFITRRGAPVEVEGIAVVHREDGNLLATSGFFRDVTEQRRTARIQAVQYAVSQILAESPEIDQAMSRVMEAIVTNLGWRAAELWQPDAAGQHLTRQYAWHVPGSAELDAFDAFSRACTLAPGAGLPGHAWQQGDLVWEEDLGSAISFNRRELAAQAGLQTGVAVPIQQASQVLGVMVFFCTHQAPDAGLAAVLGDVGRRIGLFTSRKRAEAALESERASLALRVAERTADLSHANAVLAQALHAKDEFLANMSHELRTPLNAILVLAESLLEQYRGPLNEHQQSSLHTIESSGRHLLALINDILDLSKVEAGGLALQLDVFSVADVCQSSLLFVREMALKKHLQLAFQLNDHLAQVSADPKRVKQMLVNLLSNAVKFTPSGGRVTLDVVVDSEVGEIAFTVEDTGIGINPEDLPRLFRPFMQLDSSLSRQHEGTGLGLALVQRLAELHGGSITVESDVGLGSRFTIALPYHLPEPRGAEPPEQPAPEPPEQPAPEPLPAAPAEKAAATRVLLVEDNEANIQAMSDYLRLKDYHVDVARNGAEALANVGACRPDVILMDIQMPHLDGLEVTRRLRAQPAYAHTPIIALTALAMPGDRERCLAAGASEYLTKPASLKGLVAMIQRLLAV